MATSIGIDIGGTKIAGALVDENGDVLQSVRWESPADDAAALAGTIAGVARDLAAAADEAPEAVGVACAGFIDRAGEVVLFAPNMAWRDEPLKARLEESTGMPVLLENDANAAAWGEFRFGAGREAESMVLITVGTGVGGGIVIDGELLRGAHGVGAEIGHMRVVPDGRLCGCGNKGCLEQYASGTALVRTARELLETRSPLAENLRARCGGDPARLEGRMIDEAAREGDEASVELLADLGTWLGEGAGSVCALLDPELVVIGGGVSHAGELLLGPARTAMDRFVRRGSRPHVDLVGAALGNAAGVIGAADAARARYAEGR